jgi:hypothetical protein
MEASANQTIKGEAGGPAVEYLRRLEARRAREIHLAQKFRRLSQGRGTLLALIVAVAWLGEKERFPVLPLLLTLPVVTFTASVLWRNRVRVAWRRAANATAFYQRRLDCLNDRWAGGGDPGTRYLDDAHPYALDLDVFGRGSLFERLCLDGTRLGDDTLAGWLSAAGTAAEVRERQAAVVELSTRLDLREDLALLGAEMPDGIDFKALAEWRQADPDAGSTRDRLTSAGLAVLTLATLVGWWGFGTGPLPCLAALLLEAAWALRLRGRVRRIVGAVEGKAAGLAFLVAVFARLEKERFRSPRLSRLREELTRPGGSASRQIARLRRRVTWFTLTPLAPFFLATTQVALAIAAWQRKHGSATACWLAAVGECEALCALAAYAYENPNDPFPELADDGPCLEAEGLGHPLLPRDRCVPNDVRLGSGLSVLVVSGSNMSGKSTLLRTAGANVVLALAGAPVRATCLRLSPLAVGATLRIQDSLQAGRSRFFAEVARVRQVLDLANGPLPLLFLLDELFSGTNSTDRRQGAEAVVRTLLDARAIGLVTTHDLALTQLADSLAPRGANVHFADQFENGQMTFDYRMRPGVCPSSNGLALMRAVGIVV